ncbi:unnamed protein product [Cuscuta epithymum]|uniref:BHLH domain-containing protein n=1 Tax=Cuscuta epithymum TaxID=186058 RepID=A0AAV0CBL6_9ASTE|nr:unnamed protein product [Cuscuta epithymum]
MASSSEPFFSFISAFTFTARRFSASAAGSATKSAAATSEKARTPQNREEIEIQRRTHISVERNRRKQMNEFLAVLRGLLPESYVQRVSLCFLCTFSGVFCENLSLHFTFSYQSELLAFYLI